MNKQKYFFLLSKEYSRYIKYERGDTMYIDRETEIEEKGSSVFTFILLFML